MEQSYGPVIVDLLGPELSQEEKDILNHPLVGGVILFTRNYVNPEQLIQLCKDIRAARSTPLLITVDHEGGRVQRFRDGFTRLPSMGQIGQVYLEESDAGFKMAEACGWLLATELLAVGVDLSFAPVLDLDKGICPAIGNRAFHSDPTIVAQLATAVMRGMKTAGMVSTGKHFPGHGSVNVDSHVAIPIDTRDFETIATSDMSVFDSLIHCGIQAMMPAHIIFPAVDTKPVGFSKIWLNDILRNQLHFSGVIFSDDLNMEGAGFAGDYTARAIAALDAGCDMVLICNNRVGATQILEHVPQHYQLNENKFKLLQGQFIYDHTTLRQTKTWQESCDYVTRRITNEYTR